MKASIAAAAAGAAKKEKKKKKTPPPPATPSTRVSGDGGGGGDGIGGSALRAMQWNLKSKMAASTMMSLVQLIPNAEIVASSVPVYG